MSGVLRSVICLGVLSVTACSSGAGSMAGTESLAGAESREAGAFPPAQAAAAQQPDVADTPYPIYSSYFTGDTPFHKTFSQLVPTATFRSAQIAANFWAQGIGVAQPLKASDGLSPLYIPKTGDPGYRFSCPAYHPCDATNMIVYFPSGAEASTGSDHHLTSFDPTINKGEIDGWGGYAPNEACQLKSGRPFGLATCSSGGFYPFKGSGIAYPSGSSANAGGYAFGLFQVSAQELLNGHIDHALGIVSSCLDPDTVYPSNHPGTDFACTGSLTPSAVYGDMIHLKHSVDVKDRSANPYCRTILKAFQDYGAYTSDVNQQYGISLQFEPVNNPIYPAGKNPWLKTIYPSMEATGDAATYNGAIYDRSCLQNVTADDIDVIEIGKP